MEAFKGSTQRKHSVEAFKGSVQRKHSKEAFKGSIEWKRSKEAFRGSIQWKHSKEAFKGSIQRKRSTEALNGSVQRKHSEGAFSGSIQSDSFQNRGIQYPESSKVMTAEAPSSPKLEEIEPRRPHRARQRPCIRGTPVGPGEEVPPFGLPFWAQFGSLLGYESIVFASPFLGTLLEPNEDRFSIDFGTTLGSFFVYFSRPFEIMIFATPPMRKPCFWSCEDLDFNTFWIAFSVIGSGPRFL